MLASISASHEYTAAVHLPRLNFQFHVETTLSLSGRFKHKKCSIRDKKKEDPVLTGHVPIFCQKYLVLSPLTRLEISEVSSVTPGIVSTKMAGHILKSCEK